MTSIDHKLRDLEKQVQQFTMTMSEHQALNDHERRHRNKPESSSNQDNVPLQIYKTRALPPLHQQQQQQQQLRHFNHDEEDEASRDDNTCIGSILQRAATARCRPTMMDKPNITQSRSLRSTTGRKPVKDEIVPPVPTQEDEELRFAMQRVWAVLDAESNPQLQQEPAPVTVAQTTTPMTMMPIEGTSSNEVDKSNMVSTGRIQTVPLKTFTTRIYIDDAKNHKVVQLTNLLTTAMVVQYLKKKGLVDHSDEWTLFEIANSHGVERPLRQWEIVLDIVSIWEPDASNALLVKKYSYYYTLTSESIFNKKIPPMHGWLSIEYKKGKWQKRYCFIKDNAIHHAKDNNKGSSTSILCHLGTYDVYTLLSPLKQSPTPFVFAIRAQDRSSMFEREGDYMRCLAVEDQDEMKDWVLSIRGTKSHIQYGYHPNRIMNPLAHISLEASSSADEPALRRHKSTREVVSLPKSESTRRVVVDEKQQQSPSLQRSLTRSGTTRGLQRNPTVSTSTSAVEVSSGAPLIDTTEESTYAKGSLLAKEEQAERHEEQQTLIQIDDRIKFAKGSLLDKKENATVVTHGKMTRSKSVREVSSSSTATEEQPRRQMSLRRKPTTTNNNKKHHDVPLPNTSNAATSYGATPNNTTLLRLDDTPERFHSRELHGRHVKPLLNFDSNEKPTTPLHRK